MARSKCCPAARLGEATCARRGYAVFPSVGKGAVGEDKTVLDDFTRGNFEFAAGVSAVAFKAGASADLMYEPSVGGQKFSFEKSKK